MTGKPLALPAALIFIAGLALIYFALRGLDNKHGLFGGKLAGGSAPTTDGAAG